MANVDHDTRERLPREVGETIRSLESTIRRAERALTAVGDQEPNIHLALQDALERFEAVRQDPALRAPGLRRQHPASPRCACSIVTSTEGS